MHLTQHSVPGKEKIRKNEKYQEKDPRRAARAGLRHQMTAKARSGAAQACVAPGAAEAAAEAAEAERAAEAAEDERPAKRQRQE